MLAAMTRALLLAAIVAVQPARAIAAEPVAITVILTEYKFIPDRIVLQSGVRYRLHLENIGKELHEFTATSFFKSAKIENPEVLNADQTDLLLQPHESKDLLLTPRKKSEFTLTCADHDWEGMVGKIVVE
jgi:uncharacterized cupredoxin-like copper-binding protein